LVSSNPEGSSLGPRLDGLAVLVIEDDADAREVLALALRTCGADPLEAATGEEGLEVLDRATVDAVVCDVGLPGIDGFEVARRLRGAVSRRAVRLIAVTGFGKPEDVKLAAEAGFDAHLTKPVEPFRLAVLLRELTAGGRES
jgi:CheY-like chemotaxis protein